LNNKKTHLVFIFSVGLLIVGYLGSLFLHHQRPVELAQRVDYFKANGVPDFQLLPINLLGRSAPSAVPAVSLSDLTQKVVIINFWATWCKPCVAEFPSLVVLSRLYQNDPRLKIVAIAVHSTPKDVEAFLSVGASAAPNMIVLMDNDGAVASSYGTEKIPETYIINNKHLLLNKVISEQNWVSPEFLTLLKGWL
jgi:cytochrome c biogenesis protein CcmG/thiol:disulfide interchange protein DsbE